jgi:hypothetical protein
VRGAVEISVDVVIAGDYPNSSRQAATPLAHFVQPSFSHVELVLATVISDVAADDHSVNGAALLHESAKIIEKLATLVLVRIPTIAVPAKVDVG